MLVEPDSSCSQIGLLKELGQLTCCCRVPWLQRHLHSHHPQSCVHKRVQACCVLPAVITDSDTRCVEELRGHTLLPRPALGLWPCHSCWLPLGLGHRAQLDTLHSNPTPHTPWTTTYLPATLPNCYKLDNLTQASLGPNA